MYPSPPVTKMQRDMSKFLIGGVKDEAQGTDLDAIPQVKNPLCDVARNDEARSDALSNQFKNTTRQLIALLQHLGVGLS